jgi:hypothetical protein
MATIKPSTTTSFIELGILLLTPIKLPTTKSPKKPKPKMEFLID